MQDFEMSFIFEIQIKGSNKIPYLLLGVIHKLRYAIFGKFGPPSVTLLCPYPCALE